jgi:hypothetical protein
MTKETFRKGFVTFRQLVDYLRKNPTGSLINQGFWNASTNTPALADGTGTKGFYWVVSVAATRDLGSGPQDFGIGDWVYYNSSNQYKIFETGVGYTPENVANKENTTLDTSTTKYPTNRLVKEQVDLKAAISGQAFSGNISAPKVSVGTTNTPSIETVGEGLTAGPSLAGVTQTARRTTSRIGNAELNFHNHHLHSATSWIKNLFVRSKGDTDTHISVASGDIIEESIYGGRFQSGGTGAYYPAVSIKKKIGTGTVSGTSMPGELSIEVTPDGAVAPVEVFNINSKGVSTPKAIRVPFVNLTDAATIALDLSLSNNFNLTLGGNRTLGFPTNIVAGQSGAINVRQDSAGSRTLGFAWCYVSPGSGLPVLNTGKFVMDQLMYIVNSYATAAVTISIATPAVVTWNNHGLIGGQRIRFTTTGALPTGLAINTTYWVTVVDANTFRLSSSFANLQTGTFIVTSGSQSGDHTATHAEITMVINPAMGNNA